MFFSPPIEMIDIQRVLFEIKFFIFLLIYASKSKNKQEFI